MCVFDLMEPSYNLGSTGSLPMSNARREQRQRDRISPAVTAAVSADPDDSKRKAVLNVVQVWLDRLQLVSTIVRSMSMLYAYYLY